MSTTPSPRTVSIGGATYDIFVHLPKSTLDSFSGQKGFSFPLGEKIRVEDVTETCGGGANNTSVGLARLGCDAAFCGVVGDDQWGEKLLLNLQSEGVDTSCSTVVEGEVSSFSIILSASSGERTILYDPGTNDHLHDATFDREHVASVDWVFLNHIQRSTCVIEDDIIEILTADDAPNLTWNPGGCQIDMGLQATSNQALLKHTSILQLNKEEAQKFTGIENKDEALKTLSTYGPTHVVMTDGGHGTLATDGKQIYHCPILSAGESVDTTGAGDAFGVGVTWAILSGKSLPEALQAGSINAASVVSQRGAQAGLLTHIEMDERLANTHLDVEVRDLA